jgi:aldose 1-epimerase
MAQLSMEAGQASVTVDADRGGRVASLVVDGRPLLLAGPSDDPLHGGSYPMVPWAGRVRDGRFRFGGVVHELPRNLPPHSAHGTGFTSGWEVEDDHTLGLDLGPPWPLGGRAVQRFELDRGGLTMTLAVTAERDMPVMLGWHPWFHRHLPDPDGGDVEARLRFRARSMYELDDDAIPTGRLVAPPPGPWDNCFTGVEEGPTIEWPGLVELRLSSSCDHWVVYTEPEHALCVEPQSAAPDEFNREPAVLPAGERAEAWFRLAWA